MTVNHRPAFVCAAVATFVLGVLSPIHAQQPSTEAASAVSSLPAAAPVSFGYELGHVSEIEAGTESVFSLRATQPSGSKLTGQKVRLIVEDRSAQGTKTRLLSLNTGKHKTVDQFCAGLRDIFRKYQTLGSNATGQEIGKVGDIKYGGEIRFVAESPEHLRYDMQTDGEENHSTQFSRSDVSMIVALLGQVPQARWIVVKGRLPAALIVHPYLEENWDDEDRHDVDHLDHGIDRGSRSVLVRVPNGVAGHTGCMRKRALAAVVAFLDVLLGVVPGAAAAGHGDRHEKAGDDGSQEHPSQSQFSQGGDHRDEHYNRNGEQGRDDHLAQRRLGDDVHASTVLRHVFTLEDARFRGELTTHLSHHGASGVSHRVHAERGGKRTAARLR